MAVKNCTEGLGKVPVFFAVFTQRHCFNEIYYMRINNKHNGNAIILENRYTNRQYIYIYITDNVHIYIIHR